MNSSWIFVGSTRFVGVYLCSEASMVCDVIDLSFDSSGISETIATFYGMTTSSFFLSVLIAMMIFNIISEFVWLGGMMINWFNDLEEKFIFMLKFRIIFSKLNT